MKYLSIDIETTGSDKQNCQILEFAAAFEDCDHQIPLDSIPTFERLIIPDSEIVFESDYVKKMHKGLMSEIQLGKGVSLESCMSDFNTWLLSLGYSPSCKGLIKFFVAGKNVGRFDLPILERYNQWNSRFMVGARTIDPAIQFIDWRKDTEIPTFEMCLERADVSGIVKHRALSECKQVIALLRKSYY